MWVYGVAAVVAIGVGVVAAVLPETVPAWVRQCIVVAGVVGSVLAAIFIERWYTLLDRSRTITERTQADIRESESLAIRPPHDDDAPGRLLSPVREGDQIIEFLGRKEELHELVAWCDGGRADGRRSLRVRLVTGPGGVGKTRLAEELQDRMRDRGWQCRNLRAGVEPWAMEAIRRGHGKAPILFVVDYAENRHDQLATLLEHANDDDGTVRILLLARQNGEWWTDLCQLPGVGAVVGATDPLELSPRLVPADDAMTVVEEQQRIIDAATHDFARHLDREPPAVELSEALPDARMLDLLSIALVEVLRRRDDHVPPGAGAATLSVHSVFDELLRHEVRDWSRSAAKAGVHADTHTLRTLVAAACLLGAADQEEATALVRRVSRLRHHDDAPDLVRTARWLREQYPPSARTWTGHDAERAARPQWLGSLHPDRLAEHLVVSVLSAADVADDARAIVSAERRAALLHDLDERQATQAMIVLARAASDPSRDDDVTAPGRSADPDRLDPRRSDHVARLALDLVDHLPQEWDVVSAVHETIPWPDPPSALHTVGHRIATRLSSCIPWRGRITGSGDASHAQHVLGNWAYTLGHYQEALEARERAARSYRQLAERRPGRFRPSLALALDNLADSYQSLGRYDDALQTRQDANQLWQRIHQVADDGRYDVYVARSLHNLGISYRDRGRPDLALTTHLEALDLRRSLARQYDRYESSFARSLSSIGRCRADTGDLPGALEDFLQAFERWQRIDTETPGRYGQGLASAFADLGTCYTGLGRHEEALDAHRESVALWRRLAARNPVRFESGLARALTNLASSCSETGRPDAAHTAHTEAIETYRNLAGRFPARFEPNLAWSLAGAARTLARDGRRTEALDIFAEALDLYRRRYAEGMRSVLFLSGYRVALESCTGLLDDAGLTEEARTLRDELAEFADRLP